MVQSCCCSRAYCLCSVPRSVHSLVHRASSIASHSGCGCVRAACVASAPYTRWKFILVIRIQTMPADTPSHQLSGRTISVCAMRTFSANIMRPKWARIAHNSGDRLRYYVIYILWAVCLCIDYGSATCINMNITLNKWMKHIHLYSVGAIAMPLHMYTHHLHKTMPDICAAYG